MIDFINIFVKKVFAHKKSIPYNMLFVDTGTPDVRENQGAPFLFSRSVMMQVYFFHQVVWR